MTPETLPCVGRDASSSSDGSTVEAFSYGHSADSPRIVTIQCWCNLSVDKETQVG